MLAAGAPTPTLSLEAGQALLAYPWPSNVRELEQCLARAVALATSGAIEVHHLPDAVIRPPSSPAKAVTPASLSKQDERLRAELLQHLAQHAGNVSEVARAMGKARMQIQRWMKRLRIDASDYRA